MKKIKQLIKYVDENSPLFTQLINCLNSRLKKIKTGYFKDIITFEEGGFILIVKDEGYSIDIKYSGKDRFIISLNARTETYVEVDADALFNELYTIVKGRRVTARKLDGVFDTKVVIRTIPIKRKTKMIHSKSTSDISKV